MRVLYLSHRYQMFVTSETGCCHHGLSLQKQQCMEYEHITADDE